MTPDALAPAYRGDVTTLVRLHAVARRHPHADLAIVAVVFVVTLLTTEAGPTGGRLDATAVLIAAVASGALSARRRYPVLVLLVTTAAAESYLVHYGGRNGEMLLVAPLIALYTVADLSSRRRALIASVLGVLAFAGLHMMIKPSSPLGADNVALAALGGLAVAAGNGSRNRRAYHAEVEQRAQHAEADREAEAARRVTEERLRIARDLHDAVGHQLAVIHVQANVATHALGETRPQAAEALVHIRTASNTALAELRDTIGLLRQPGDSCEPGEPVTGMAGLDDLLTSFQRCGLTVTRQAHGAAHPLAPATDLTAYRVIQESLTNVSRHSGASRASVILTYRPDTLRITVHNGGTRSARAVTRPGTEGHGLAGMRERVHALGGQLDAGHQPDGGFQVSATLPLPGRPA
jgi:signal transduction histidine kinase